MRRQAIDWANAPSEQAWTIFQAIERHCRLPSGGYASIRDVDELPVVHEDRQETFFLSETLKCACGRRPS